MNVLFYLEVDIDIQGRTKSRDPLIPKRKHLATTGLAGRLSESAATRFADGSRRTFV